MRICSTLIVVFFALLLPIGSQAQRPKTFTNSELYEKVKKLNVLASALYVAAHPDDENTQLISFLVNDVKAETSYLSLTRGNGGQNLISDQLNAYLGIIRTEELLNARKIDGGVQYFSSADDFGFSKRPQEALETWDKQKILSEVVYTIRALQPDIIINRFDHRKEGITHGHHTASAQLSYEAFEASNNHKAYVNKQFVQQPWQPQRLFFNVSWYFFGSQEAFKKADKSKYIALETGTYYAALDRSNQEIAALSRSQHQSQGFGDLSSRGQQTEYLELIKGSALHNEQNLFEGIDITWNRVKNGQPIGVLVEELLQHYDFKNKENNLKPLMAIYKAIDQLEDGFWKTKKLEEVKELIYHTAGLFLEMRSQEQMISPGTASTITLELINRSSADISTESVQWWGNSEQQPLKSKLQNNVDTLITQHLPLPKNLPTSQPQWINDPEAAFYAQFAPQPTSLTTTINLRIEGVPISFTLPWVYVYKDRVKGELYDRVLVVPPVSITPQQPLVLFSTTGEQAVEVNFESLSGPLTGKARLVSEKGHTTAWQTLHLENTGAQEKRIFHVPLTKDDIYTVTFCTAEEVWQDNVSRISYDHIPSDVLLQQATLQLKKIDLKIEPKKIAYQMGAGDQVGQSLRNVGYDVTFLTETDWTAEKLATFDVVILGIRVYNTKNFMTQKQPILLDYVKNGGHVIVQYTTDTPLFVNNIGPYPLQLSKNRVTEENAKVKFLVPHHRVLSHPNKISSEDFNHWIQEQSLYLAASFDPRYTPILTSHDTHEAPQNGSLLITEYGKGTFIYTGLSFFRQLPAGVSGAYRLFSNLISFTSENEKE